MVDVSRQLSHAATLRGAISFEVGDATALRFDDASFDIVVSQRCLLNLPSREHQWRAMAEISRVLKPEGQYLMLEGTLQGLRRLNGVRQKFGLAAIAEADPQTNRYSLKFDESELEQEIPKHFSRIDSVERFGMYFFLSRVVHPLLAAPDSPRYDAPLNLIARQICAAMPDFQDMGHVALWVLRR
jgi:ubiquinone/menaquinone biosynthesis C-methylase UbiE